MAPVWLEAALAPAAVVPDLIMITGLWAVTSEAARTNRWPSSTLST